MLFSLWSWGPVVGAVGSWLASLGITGVVAAAAAWGLFKWLGRKWLEDHFAKELEAFKAEKQAELEKLKTEYGRETERLKADLNLFADRASRFHVREYEVLPEAWGLLNKAYSAALDAVSFYQEYPDLNKMSEGEFDIWLERSNLNKQERAEISAETNKNKYYVNIQDRQKLKEAFHAVAEFLNYVIMQGVFIDEVLNEKLTVTGMKLRGALLGRSMYSNDHRNHNADDKTDFWLEAVNETNKAGQVVLEIKDEVRRRLSNIRLAPPGEDQGATTTASLR